MWCPGANTLALASLFCFLAPARAHWELPEWARGGQIWAALVEAEAASPHVGNSTPNYYDQWVDHGNTSAGTFQQRYYVDTAYWNGSSESPVFYYIGGEGTLRGTPTGYAATLAQEFGALVVALEHRWYGASIPGDITSTRDLQVSLTVEQALEDLAAFQIWMTAQLGGTTGPWLAIGGSYPGALSAWCEFVRGNCGRSHHPPIPPCLIAQTGWCTPSWHRHPGLHPASSTPCTTTRSTMC